MRHLSQHNLRLENLDRARWTTRRLQRPDRLRSDVSLKQKRIRFRRNVASAPSRAKSIRMRGPSKSPKKLSDLFNAKWVPEPFSGCWLWIGAAIEGYGTIRGSRDEKFKNTLAHHVSWRLHRGPIPKGFIVMHKCDTPCCVNPDHLRVGTYRDNRIDAKKKGRQLIIRNALGQISAITTA